MKTIWIKEVEDIGQHWSRAWVSADPEPDSIEKTDVQAIIGLTTAPSDLDSHKELHSLREKIKEYEAAIFSERVKKHALIKENARLMKQVEELTSSAKPSAEASSFDQTKGQLGFEAMNKNVST